MQSRSPFQYEKNHKMQQTLNGSNTREKNKMEKELCYSMLFYSTGITKKKDLPHIEDFVH